MATSEEEINQLLAASQGRGRGRNKRRQKTQLGKFEVGLQDTTGGSSALGITNTQTGKVSGLANFQQNVPTPTTTAQRLAGGAGGTQGSAGANVSGLASPDSFGDVQPETAFGTTGSPLPSDLPTLGDVQTPDSQLGQLDEFGRTTFQTPEGSVSTRSALGAARLEQGQGILGGQVGNNEFGSITSGSGQQNATNIDNIVASNRLDNARRAVDFARSEGLSIEEQLNAFNTIQAGGDTPQNLTEEQLAKVDSDERRGLISTNQAFNRRLKLNSLQQRERKTVRDAGIAEQDIQAGSSEFEQQQAVRSANATTARGRLQLAQREFLGGEKSRSQQRQFKETETLFRLLNDETNPADLGELATSFGAVKVLQLHEESNRLAQDAKLSIRSAQTPQEKQNILLDLRDQIEEEGIPVELQDVADFLNS